MDLRIDMELQGPLLMVIASGSVRPDAASRLIKQACEQAAENQVNKVLVNALAVQGELAAFEKYTLGVEIAEYLAERRMNLKLAFVGIPPVMDGFAVRVARNRGVVTNVFPTQQEALKWLDDLPGVSEDQL